ncbi:MAG TPA: ankyrin repeat domain-containing protein [Burkholderiales bacterium]|nr:ankyrin repeat domain-containing protein [Burkholderiales bacterium]
MIQRTIEKDDLLTKMRVREVLLFGLIAMTAVLANLPAETIAELGINHDYLIAGLGCAVVIGLFLYLKFFFFLAVALLIVGANMPEQIAERFSISKIPLILALVALVGISLINYVVKLLPTGLEPKPKEKSAEGVRAMFYAIEKNNVVYGQKVLSMNFDANLHHDNGYTPLAYAAMKGNPQMVELFLRNGADPAQTTREGDTPVELALRMGHNEVADALKRARQQREAAPAAPAPAQARA